MSEQPKTLDEALAALQYDPPVLVKDKKGQVGNQKTKYADLVQVNAIVLSRLNGLGVIYICMPNLLDDGKFVLEYELLHVASGDARRGRYPLKLSENPQQMGSAITYARRYVLLSLTGVAAEDEDDDGYAPNGRGTAQRAPRGQAAQPPTSGRGETAQRARTSSGPPLPGEDAPTGLIDKGQMARMQALFNANGITEREDKLNYATQVIGRDVSSAKELTIAEASKVINALDVPDDTDGGATDEH